MDEKQLKDEINQNVREDRSSSADTSASVERLRTLYQKTEQMKEQSKLKNEEIENQFKHLKERLTTSSGFLSNIKKSIENIKFGYEKDIVDLEKMTEESRSDMDRQIEEIRAHIDRIKSRVVVEEKRQAQNYQEAFSDVLSTLEGIAQTKYQ